MKNKLLYTEVTKAAEALATALRKFSGDPMYCNVSIVTRDRVQDAAEAPDVYTIRVHKANEENPVGNLLITESGFIYRAEDGKVAKIERIITGGEVDDTQG